MKKRRLKKKQITSRRAKRVLLPLWIFAVINFVFFFIYTITNRGTAFIAGKHDETGYYIIDHGIRVDFDATTYWVGCVQGWLMLISVVLSILCAWFFYCKGEIKIVEVEID